VNFRAAPGRRTSEIFGYQVEALEDVVPGPEVLPSVVARNLPACRPRRATSHGRGDRTLERPLHVLATVLAEGNVMLLRPHRVIVAPRRQRDTRVQVPPWVAAQGEVDPARACGVVPMGGAAGPFPLTAERSPHVAIPFAGFDLLVPWTIKLLLATRSGSVVGTGLGGPGTHHPPSVCRGLSQSYGFWGGPPRKGGDPGR
jgi:hypothetical protein